MKIIPIKTLLASLLLVFVSTAFAADVKQSVVQVFSDGAPPNFAYPWQIGDIQSGYGSGVIIKGNRILTAAHVVDDSVSLLVRKVGSDKRYPARVAFISDERDLAIVTVNDETFFDGTTALDIGELPVIGQEIITWGFPVGGNQLAITKGIVSRIDFDGYSHSGFPNLVAQIDAAINPGSSGGPALVNNKIAGITFQGIRNANSIGYIVPASVIDQFLIDIKDGRVNGVPEIGVNFQFMENPPLRHHYGMQQNQSGVLITHLSGMEKKLGYFRKNDVILKMAGETVGNDGSVAYSTGDRVNMDYLLTRRQIGEVITVDVLRDKKPLRIDYTITYSRSEAMMMPHHASDYKPDYIVIGGMVFQELSHDYMKVNYNDYNHAPGWMEAVKRQYKTTELAQTDRAIILSKILPDEINQGYENIVYPGDRIKFINGNSVNSIAIMRAALADASQPDIHIEFEPSGELVFNKDELAKREAAIAEKYDIN